MSQPQCKPSNNDTNTCERCGVTCNTTQEWTDHLQAHDLADSDTSMVHIISAGVTLDCPNCPLHFSDFQQLQDHVVAHAHDQFLTETVAIVDAAAQRFRNDMTPPVSSELVKPITTTFTPSPFDAQPETLVARGRELLKQILVLATSTTSSSSNSSLVLAHTELSPPVPRFLYDEFQEQLYTACDRIAAIPSCATMCEHLDLLRKTKRSETEYLKQCDAMCVAFAETIRKLPDVYLAYLDGVVRARWSDVIRVMGQMDIESLHHPYRNCNHSSRAQALYHEAWSRWDRFSMEMQKLVRRLNELLDQERLKLVA